MKKFRPAIGVSDFRKLRESGADYVDKSSFISEILEDRTEVLLFPRPRRFGKTLNLSMIGHFLRKSKDDLLPLFAGLDVTRDAQAMAHFQRYPVVSITFKDVKATTFAATLQGIGKQIEQACRDHRDVVDAQRPGTGRSERLTKYLMGTGNQSDLESSFLDLSTMLHEHYGERVVILIDEYDTPVQSGYSNGFFDDIVSFFRNFFSACLKDNNALFKSVMTGILRVSKENMFSGLNHIRVHSMIDTKYATAFGFTEGEVAAIIESERLEEVRAWYNGYIFGGHVIYNPWSILCYIEEGLLKPYWVNTASSELIEKLALKLGLGLSAKSEALLAGGTIDMQIDSNVVLRDIELSPDSFWNFLLFAGYLKTVDLRIEEGEYFAKLAIPNKEVRLVYQDLFRTWLFRADPKSDRIAPFVKALLAGDAATVQDLLEDILLKAMSYYDPAGDEPEKLYHGLILGLLVHLEKHYEVRSNQESGYGRADMLMRPKTAGHAGVVIEFKVLNKRNTVDEVLKDAAKQVRDRRYATDLVAAGATPVYEYAMVFDGKRAHVKLVDDALAWELKAPARKGAKGRKRAG